MDLPEPERAHLLSVGSARENESGNDSALERSSSNGGDGSNRSNVDTASQEYEMGNLLNATQQGIEDIEPEDLHRVSVHEIDTDNISGYESVLQLQGQQEDVEEMPLPVRCMWTPFCLRPFMLIAFMVFTMSLIAALEVVYQVANRNQGLASTSQKEHYLWTYGPTAAFTLVSSFWGRIAYHTALLTPWKAMQKGPVSAERSLFVDYRSSSMLLALWSSLRNRHFAMLLAVFGTLVLLVETVLSTALFALRAVSFSDHSASVRATEYYLGLNTPNTGSPVTFDGAAILSTIGILSQNLSSPAGTNSLYATQSFELASRSQNPGSSLTAVINGTSASLVCEPAPIDSVTLFSGIDYDLGFPFNETIMITANYTTSMYNLSSNACHAGLRWSSEYAAYSSDQSRQCTPYGFMGINTTSGITATGTTSTCWNFQTLQNETCWAFFYASYERPFDNLSWYSLAESNNRSVKISPHGWLQVSALLCQTAYVSGPVQVTIDSSGTLLDVVPDTAIGTDVSDKTIINSLVSESILAFMDGLFGSSDAFFDGFFNVLYHSSLQINYTSLLEPGALENAVSQIYSAIYAQGAKQYFFVAGSAKDPGNITFQGTYNWDAQRLVVHSVTARTVEALLAVLMFITAGIYVLPSAFSTPVNPGSLGGLACVLFKSSGLICAVNQCLGPEETSDCRTVKGRDSEGNSTIMVRAHIITAVNESGQDQEVEFFRPTYGLLPFKVSIIATPLFMIAILETTYQISEHRNGLATVSSVGYEHYAWTAFPALLLSGLGLAYKSMASTVRMLYPLAVLRTGTVDVKRSLLDLSPSQNTAFAFVDAARRREFALAVILLTTLVTPLLTIVASGLFTTQPVLFPLDSFSLPRSDVFDISLLNNVSGYPVSSLCAANLVIRHNLSYPDGTYKNMLLPAFTLDSNTLHLFEASINTTAFELGYQALRLNQICNLIDDDRLSRQLCSDGFADDCGPTEISISSGLAAYVTYPGLADCVCLQNETNVCVNATPAIQFMQYDQGYGSPDLINEIRRTEEPSGFFATAGFFGKDQCFSAQNSTQEFLDALQSPDTSSCATYTLLWGYANNVIFDRVHGFSCTPSWELVNVTATYSVPNKTLLSVNVDEKSAQPYDTTQWIELVKEYTLPSITEMLIQTGQNAFANNNNVLNFIFESLSPNGSALGESNVNTDPIVVMKAYEQVYEKFYVQLINKIVRSPIPLDTTAFTGHALAPTTRLLQSGISTRILEGLLAILCICATITFVLFDPNNLSPDKPCSIATQAALLAGSDELLKLVPDDMTKYDDKSLKAIFGGYFYSLGWWDSKAGGRRFGIGIGQADREK